MNFSLLLILSIDHVNQTCLRCLGKTYIFCNLMYVSVFLFIKMWTVKSNICIIVINYSVVVRDTSFIYTCKAHRYTFFLVLSLLVIRDLEDHVETTYWIRYSAVLLISHKNSFGHLNSVLRMCWLSFNATTVRDVRL